jgi:hypothetical protein
MVTASSKFERGGGGVHGDDGRIEDPRLDPAFPRHDEGHADAAFQEFAFAAAQWGVAGGEFLGRAAVVADEKDEGVFLHATLPQLRHDRAHAVVKMCDHCGVDAALNVLDMRKLRHVGVRALHRAVRGVVGEIEKPRLCLVPRDEIARLAREGIGQVRALVRGLAAA